MAPSYILPVVLNKLLFWIGFAYTLLVNCKIVFLFPVHLKTGVPKKQGRIKNVLTPFWGATKYLLPLRLFEENLFFKQNGKIKQKCDLQVCTPALSKMAALVKQEVQGSGLTTSPLVGFYYAVSDS